MCHSVGAQEGGRSKACGPAFNEVASIHANGATIGNAARITSAVPIHSQPGRRLVVVRAPSWGGAVKEALDEESVLMCNEPSDDYPTAAEV